MDLESLLSGVDLRAAGALLASLATFGAVGLALLPRAAAAPPPDYVNLAHGPYPHTALPVQSRFDQGSVFPFELLAAFNDLGSGQLSYEAGLLRYASAKWSWLATRTAWQDRVCARWIWKALKGGPFIIEAWDAYDNLAGRTAMLSFHDGKAYQERPGLTEGVYLADVDPFQDFVTVEMAIDYTVPEIAELYINNMRWTHLAMRDEPIAKETPFWQLQVFLPYYAEVQVREISAWKPSVPMPPLPPPTVAPLPPPLYPYPRAT